MKFQMKISKCSETIFVLMYAYFTGSLRGWAWMNGIMLCISNFATLMVNNPDFTRFASSPSAAFWPQLFTIPIGFSVTSFIGVIVGSSSNVIFDQAVWNPLDLLGKFLDSEPTAGTRAGVFFISLGFALAQLGVNIAANSISAGSDLTALLPKFLNIRRSGYICAIVGLVLCPWNLLNTSSKFTSYLSAYSTFLSSVVGVMISDYYFVRKGYLNIEELYSGSKQGDYYFTFGVNWRAYAAYIAGILINIVGFAGAVGASVPIAAQNMYNLNFYLGFIVSSVIYCGLCKLSPVPACGQKWPSEVVDDKDNIIVLKVVSIDMEEQNDSIKLQDQKVVDEVCRL
jgi:NCS1 family nucleobase:cation symporter-1